MGIGFDSVAWQISFFLQLSGRGVDRMEEYYLHHSALLYFLFFFISISFPVLAAAAFPLHLTQIYDLGFDIWK